MEKVMKNKVIIGVIIFYALLIYVGGIMTRGMNIQSNEQKSLDLQWFLHSVILEYII